MFGINTSTLDSSFEWDEEKNKKNQAKHGISFEEAQQAFQDIDRLIIEDVKHSNTSEERFYCIGKVQERICTVRFLNRNNKLRIIGAGFWRKEQKFYEKINSNRYNF